MTSKKKIEATETDLDCVIHLYDVVVDTKEKLLDIMLEHEKQNDRVDG